MADIEIKKSQISSRYEAVKVKALDGKTWWRVFDLVEKKFSGLLCFGKYKTKKECNTAIYLREKGII